MVDLFWSIATSHIVLAIVGAVLLAALIVGYFPLLKWFPILGDYVPVAKLVSLLAASLLAFLIGFRIADERAETKSLRAELAAKSIDLKAAQDAAKDADQARQQLAQQADDDQKRIADYAEQLKKRPNGACILAPDDFSGGVRKSDGGSRK
ncbi:MAG TPA: hypothetical protein VGC26_09750 [Afipia sp.]